MFSLEYEDWKVVCSHIFTQKPGRKKIYLQWYPFYKISNKDRQLILSEDFFNEWIKSGLFLYFSETWLVCNNYMLKGDGSFRNASLVSPLQYLLALTIGKNISKYFHPMRPDAISVLYAGNYKENRFYYQKDYDAFFKIINNLSQKFMYFLKTDIKDFYANININKLFFMINDRVNKPNVQISQKELMIYKELMLFLGQGEYPLIENSVVSSYLSTVVYLEKPDTKLHWYLTNKEKDISDFVMVRYVDDLYILFNSHVSYDKLTPIENRILNYYSSELKTINLSLNRSKTSLKKSSEINEELKKSNYDELFSKKKSKITGLVNVDSLIHFIEEIEISLHKFNLDQNNYVKIIDNVFKVENTEYSPQEIFNSIVYHENSFLTDRTFVEKMIGFVSIDYSFLKLDPKRLVILLVKTKNETLIKLFLNKLFEVNRNDTWDTYDTSLALNYLIQRGFQHGDMLNIIKKRETYIYSYYNYFCKNSLICSYKCSPENYIRSFNTNLFFKKDEKLFFLYFMYMIERQKGNYLAAFAYFKNFFDRISSHFGFHMLNDCVKRKPNYKKYYKEETFKKLYSNIANFETIINKAHKIRNENPMSHSSAELLDNNNSDGDIIHSINDLTFLISEMILNYSIIQGAPNAL